MAFWWTYETVEGQPVGKSPSFDNQGDAETWIGLEFDSVAESGADQVRLIEDDREIYGPMSLHAG